MSHEGELYLKYAITHEHERPIRIIKFSDGFVSTDDPGTIGMSATGPGALQTLALRLAQSGFDPQRKLVIYRSGQCIGTMSIAQAGGICDGCA